MKNANTLAPEIAAALEEMRNELESFRLEVILVPQRYRTNEGGMVRCAVGKNAPWYRRFCARFSSSRRRKNSAFDTRIKRADTHRVLSALCEGRATASQYANDILAEAQKRVRANPQSYALAVATNGNPF